MLASIFVFSMASDIGAESRGQGRDSLVILKKSSDRESVKVTMRHMKERGVKIHRVFTPHVFFGKMSPGVERELLSKKEQLNIDGIYHERVSASTFQAHGREAQFAVEVWNKLVPPPLDQWGLGVSGVTVTPNPVNPRKGKKLTVGFHVNKAAKVTILIFASSSSNFKKHLTTTYQSPEQALGAGASTLRWDGRTLQGTPVPPGRYLVTVIATDGVGVASQTVAFSVANEP